MTDEPTVPKAEKPTDKLDPVREENIALKLRVSSLESDLRLRDAEIAHLRKFKPATRSTTATDRFQRPIRRR